MDKDVKRIRLLKIWEILNTETDEEHFIGTEELIKRLKSFGIECVRSTLYEDIKTLQKYGYEIFCNRSTSNNYYVCEHVFSSAEALIIMDAVQSAGFITEKKTAELVDKIAKTTGVKSAEILKRNIVEFTVAKSKNENIFYSVSEITQAIISKKKIFFNYFDYGENYKRVYRKNPLTNDIKNYVTNPLGTVFDNGYYYLFAFDETKKKVINYRIDRMDNVKTLDEDISKEIENIDFDLPTRKRQLFSMYGGETKVVEMSADISLLDVIYDKFGDYASVRFNKNEVIITAEIQISPTFIAWCCSLGDKIKVLSPSSVVDKIKNYIKSLNEIYQNKV